MTKKSGMLALLFVSTFFSFLFCSGIFPAAAQEDAAPRISIEELKTMLDEGQEVVILDTQPKSIYDMGHIKGAVSFPWAMKIDSAKAGSLPKDKLIVTYCDCGPGEADSNHVAVELLKMGFQEVWVLEHPSVQGWMEKGYPTE